MAGNASDVLENDVLNRYLKNSGTTITPTSTVYVALGTAAYNENVVAAASMSEVTGTGYTRKAVTWGTVAAGAVTNSADVVWTATAADWSGTIISMYIVNSSAGAGDVLFGDTVSPSVTLGLNDSLTFATGQISISLT